MRDWIYFKTERHLQKDVVAIHFTNWCYSFHSVHRTWLSSEWLSDTYKFSLLWSLSTVFDKIVFENYFLFEEVVATTFNDCSAWIFFSWLRPRVKFRQYSLKFTSLFNFVDGSWYFIFIFVANILNFLKNSAKLHNRCAVGSLVHHLKRKQNCFKKGLDKLMFLLFLKQWTLSFWNIR